jgi:hypothetical protein
MTSGFQSCEIISIPFTVVEKAEMRLRYVSHEWLTGFHRRLGTGRYLQPDPRTKTRREGPENR